MKSRSVTLGHFESTYEMLSMTEDVLRSGRISYGPLSMELEERFADLHQCDFGVLSASGTDSLRAALHALMIQRGWNYGDEVIVPATTFVASVNVIDQVGLEPVLVDVEPDMYCLDPEKAEAAITGDTVAIMPVNLLGQPANLSEIHMVSLYTAKDAVVIEDSCESMFVKHGGISVGAWGEVGVFSFYMAHLITAGVGGIAITDDYELAETIRSLVNHGRSPKYISIDDDDELEGDALASMIRQRYAFRYQGYSSRITELQAALALAQLDTYEDMLARRQAIAGMLTRGLSKHSERLQLPVEREQGEHAYMMYGIKMRGGRNKWPLLKRLEENGIETREMLPIVNQRMYVDLVSEAAKRENDLSVSLDLIKTGFYIGCHQGMSDEDAEYVCEVVDDFFGS